MELKWTRMALSDLERLYEFLAPANKPAAARAVQALTKAPTTLLTNPRIGEPLSEFEPREVRRLLVGHYEMRYEIRESTIYLLRYNGVSAPSLQKSVRNAG
ncbi:type II toxin-antitoxin system RelE/ParE family toxin [Endothiovibrio diazotrophicus]